MTHLVRGDRDGRDGIPVVNTRREVDRSLARVVVIGERTARRLLDGNIRETVVVEDHPRDLLTGHPVRDLRLHLLGHGLLQPVLNHEADNQRRDQEDEVDTQVSHMQR